MANHPDIPSFLSDDVRIVIAVGDSRDEDDMYPIYVWQVPGDPDADGVAGAVDAVVNLDGIKIFNMLDKKTARAYFATAMATMAITAAILVWL